MEDAWAFFLPPDFLAPPGGTLHNFMGAGRRPGRNSPAALGGLEGPFWGSGRRLGGERLVIFFGGTQRTATQAALGGWGSGRRLGGERLVIFLEALLSGVGQMAVLQNASPLTDPSPRADGLERRRGPWGVGTPSGRGKTGDLFWPP